MDCFSLPCVLHVLPLSNYQHFGHIQTDFGRPVTTVPASYLQNNDRVHNSVRRLTVVIEIRFTLHRPLRADAEDFSDRTTKGDTDPRPKPLLTNHPKPLYALSY
jgi:hypothetical protein